MEAQRGRVVNARVDLAGSAVLTDAFEGDESIFVDDAGDFSEAGGQVKLYDGSLATYTAADMETGELTIPAGLDADVPAGKLVRVFPIRSAMLADVELMGRDEPLTVLVPHHLRPFLAEGSRDGSEQECSVIFDGAGWLLFDVQGQGPRLGSAHASNFRVFRYVAEGIAAADYRGVKLTGYEGTIQQAWATVDDAPVADATWELRLSGALVATLTILAGELKSALVDVADVAFDEGDVFRVRTDDPSDAGPNLRVRVRVTLRND